MNAKLTEKQQVVYDLRNPTDGSEQKTFQEIAAMLGRGLTVIKETYRVAEQKKLGIVRERIPAIREDALKKAVENRVSPERAVDIMDRITDPFRKMKEAAVECGMKPAVIDGLMKRMQTRYLGVTEQMRAIKTKDMIQKMDERIGHALNYIDDYVLADANFRDLAMGIGVLIEKRQLLKGEPTQIISIDERKSLNELLPMLVTEAKRRGLTIDVTPVKTIEAA